MNEIRVLDHGFIKLVDHMGDDSAIVQAARVSYGKDEQKPIANPDCQSCKGLGKDKDYPGAACDCKWTPDKVSNKDRHLIRYLLRHSHTTPFEMVEFKFCVQAPMDVMRQWIRHRTANVNEYSTRYMEAIDLTHSTLPGEWRLQATDNKQGSSGYLEEWPKGYSEHRDSHGTNYWIDSRTPTKEESFYYSELKNPGQVLSELEQKYHESSKILYQQRLRLGIAKEQARKDLPLSTYTRLYWKCDLHNIFNFLRLRMDSHAQWEIRQYANAMYELIKPICPVACEAFEDYVLHTKKFSRMEMDFLRDVWNDATLAQPITTEDKPSSMSDREWKEFLEKLEGTTKTD